MAGGATELGSSGSSGPTHGSPPAFRMRRRFRMDEMVAFCGLTCTSCPAFIATQNDDDEARREIAAKWSSEFGSDIRPEDINCDGCMVDDGRHIAYCGMCEIRKCGRERSVENCAYCPDYGCEKIAGFLAKAEVARARLERIRRGLA
jgi:hypothetical protein